MFRIQKIRLARMILAVTAGGILSLSLSPQTGHAATYGYSLNLNFGASESPVSESAGFYGDKVWNNLPSEQQGVSQGLFTDAFGDDGQSPISMFWVSDRIGQNEGLQTPNQDDANMMAGYLASPARIELNGLEFAVPPHEGPLNYTLLIYTYGGQEGAEGTVSVNGLTLPHIDSSNFDGSFHPGIDGNVLIISDLSDPFLDIQTFGDFPMNAMTVSYFRSGDFNSDGMVDGADLEELNQATKGGSSDWQYDINIDGQVDNDDVLAWINVRKGTCIGDVNLDGVFDSTDLIELFQVGIYESGDTATWVTGDWNGDCVFDSSDLLLAFQEGCYETNNATAPPAESVPEPAGVLLLGSGLVGWFIRQRRSKVAS